MDLVMLATVPTYAVLVFVLAPILDSIERKIRAKIHSRVGPPLLQTWYDILKLFSKELKIPRGSELSVFTILTMFGVAIALPSILGYVLCVGLNPCSIAILLVMVLALHTLSIVSYSTCSNPYALMGAFRSITIALVNELGIAVSFALSAYSAMQLVEEFSLKNLALVMISVLMFMISAYVACARIPYDLHEAEPELASGSIIEFSGPILGLYLYTHLIERFVLTAMVSLILIHFLQTNVLLTSLLSMVITVILWMLFAVLSCILGRTRIDLGLKFMISTYSVLTLLWVIVWIL